MLKEKLRPHREQRICIEMEGGMNIEKKKLISISSLAVKHEHDDFYFTVVVLKNKKRYVFGSGI